MRTILLAPFLLAVLTPAQTFPKPAEADFATKDFRFASGQVLPELRIHYRTLGTPRRDAAGHTTNAVLILHGTTGNGGNFFREEFAGQLFGKGQPLDAERWFLVVPDGIGHGGSSKPSDGLRARFPNYRYADMVRAEHLLVTEGLAIDRLRLVIGTSMGGMHAWLWGCTYPVAMDALLPLASLPAAISGRNRMWRTMIVDAIRSDPAWQNGDYTTQPRGLRTAAQILYFMRSNPRARHLEFPTGESAERALLADADRFAQTADANDVLYAVEASRDYDPDLEVIEAPLLAINFADDLVNPPDQGILENRIRLVRRGRAITIPQSDRTRGHGTHTLAAIWKEHLVAFMKATEPR